MTKGFQVLDESLLDQVSAKAKAATRQRINHNFHELTDNVQRMLNAVEPNSYVRPHRHLNPPKCENFLVLRGKLAVIFFEDSGKISDIIMLSEHGQRGVDIKPGVWHSIASLAAGTVIFEVKDGPYIQANDKDFAKWAPEENTSAAQEYLRQLKKQIEQKGQ